MAALSGNMLLLANNPTKNRPSFPRLADCRAGNFLTWRTTQKYYIPQTKKEETSFLASYRKPNRTRAQGQGKEENTRTGTATTTTTATTGTRSPDTGSRPGRRGCSPGKH